MVSGVLRKRTRISKLQGTVAVKFPRLAQRFTTVLKIKSRQLTSIVSYKSSTKASCIRTVHIFESTFFFFQIPKFPRTNLSCGFKNIRIRGDGAWDQVVILLSFSQVLWRNQVAYCCFVNSPKGGWSCWKWFTVHMQDVWTDTWPPDPIEIYLTRSGQVEENWRKRREKETIRLNVWQKCAFSAIKLGWKRVSRPVKNMLPRYMPLITSSHFEIFQHKVPREYIKIRLGIWLTGFALYYGVLAKALEYLSIIRSSS